MAKFKIIDNTKGAYAFHCPGCKCGHTVFTQNEGYSHPIWEFNGDVNSPTISPSLKNVGEYPEGVRVCHSFITSGHIEFLSDCTHELAGKIVEIQNIV
jgi:hypothetical protein